MSSQCLCSSKGLGSHMFAVSRYSAVLRNCLRGLLALSYVSDIGNNLVKCAWKYRLL